MKLNAQSLRIEVQRDLDHIHIEHTLPTKYCEHALKLLHTSIEKLENQLAKYCFPSKSKETNFLTSIGIQFAFWHIYYHEINNIDDQKPCENAKKIRNYYRGTLEKLQKHSETQLDFSNYCRLRKTHQESNECNEDKTSSKSVTDEYSNVNRTPLLTPDDFNSAKLPANNLITLYLEYELAKLDARHQANIFPIIKPIAGDTS